MPDHSDATGNLTDLVDGLLRNLDAKSREALDKYLEIEQTFVARQQDHMASFLEKQAEAQRDFVRMVSSAFVSASELNNHYRATLRETQKAFTDAHLRFVQRLRDTLRNPHAPAGPPKSGSGRPRR
jgi:hypothetical protein